MTEPGKFDPRHSGELLKHMDKRNEILMETYRSMLHELQKLQEMAIRRTAKSGNKKMCLTLSSKVEEEMLMRTLYEVMSVHRSTKQNVDNSNISHDSEGADQSINEVNTDHEEH